MCVVAVSTKVAFLSRIRIGRVSQGVSASVPDGAGVVGIAVGTIVGTTAGPDRITDSRIVGSTNGDGGSESDVDAVMGAGVDAAGRPVGSAVDWAVGSRLDGACVCFCVGSLVVYDGIVDGFSVGVTDGSSDGLGDGFADGASDGAADVGRRVDGDCIGDADGTTVGFAVGSSVGLLVVG